MYRYIKKGWVTEVFCYTPPQIPLLSCEKLCNALWLHEVTSRHTFLACPHSSRSALLFACFATVTLCISAGQRLAPGGVNLQKRRNRQTAMHKIIFYACIICIGTQNYLAHLHGSVTPPAPHCPVRVHLRVRRTVAYPHNRLRCWLSCPRLESNQRHRLYGGSSATSSENPYIRRYYLLLRHMSR